MYRMNSSTVQYATIFYENICLYSLFLFRIELNLTSPDNPPGNQLPVRAFVQLAARARLRNRRTRSHNNDCPAILQQLSAMRLRSVR